MWIWKTKLATTRTLLACRPARKKCKQTLFARSRSIQVNLNKWIHHKAIIARTNQYQRGSWEGAKGSDIIGPRRAIRLYQSINLDKNRFNFLTKFLRGANNFFWLMLGIWTNRLDLLPLPPFLGQPRLLTDFCLGVFILFCMLWSILIKKEKTIGSPKCYTTHRQTEQC